MDTRTDTKTNRLAVWGNSMLNKLTSRNRKSRKRAASKKRRAMLKRQQDQEKRSTAGRVSAESA